MSAPCFVEVGPHPGDESPGSGTPLQGIPAPAHVSNDHAIFVHDESALDEERSVPSCRARARAAERWRD
ncbi:hypothetical protein IMZ48_11450 [Candidatus Bathyarchaeota archaeon]|nr:hypothetical protein [Candidatus Bathyarchaeota archaeon]